MDIKDKIAVITGGASGIGLGIGQALIAQGARYVVLADIEHDKAKAAAKDLGGRAQGVALDVRDMAAFEALADTLYKAHGRVNIMINNAGVSGGGVRLMDTKEDEVDWLLDINVKGVWRGCAVFGKRMSAQKSPAIICNIGSENSLGFVNEGLSVYAATKHAVLGMSDVLRHELPAHVKVCVAFPGLVNTNIATSSRHGPRGPLPAEQVASMEAFMAHGTQPKEAGEQIVAGLRREDFIIPLHPHVIKLAQTRWEEIAKAYAAHAPYTKDSEAMNVRHILARLQAQHR